MNRHAAIAALLIASMPVMSACSQRSDAGNGTAAAVAETVRSESAKGLKEARAKLETENITLSDDKSAPRAEITPKGDLLIDGRAVAVNAGQRALLLKYRGQIAAIAASGMDIGMQGADLGAKAAGEAIQGIFSGGIDEKAFEARVSKQADQLKASAMQICDRMPAMLATQDALVASLPEFKPYAKMDRSDVDDCRKDGGKDGSKNDGRNET